MHWSLLYPLQISECWQWNEEDIRFQSCQRRPNVRTTHIQCVHLQGVYVHTHMHTWNCRRQKAHRKIHHRPTAWVEQNPTLKRCIQLCMLYSTCPCVSWMCKLTHKLHMGQHAYLFYMHVHTCTCMCVCFYFTCVYMYSFPMTVWLLQRILGQKLRSLVIFLSHFPFFALQHFSRSRTLHGIRWNERWMSVFLFGALPSLPENSEQILGLSGDIWPQCYCGKDHALDICLLESIECFFPPLLPSSSPPSPIPTSGHSSCPSLPHWLSAANEWGFQNGRGHTDCIRTHW